MPIEELLALYRRNIPEPSASNVTSTSADDDEERPKPTESDTQPTSSESTSQLENDKSVDECDWIDRVAPHKPSSNLSKLISNSEDALYDISDDEEDDEDDTPEDNWRRTIQIGPDHQAAVPEYPAAEAAEKREEAETKEEAKTKEEANTQEQPATEKPIETDNTNPSEAMGAIDSESTVDKEGMLLWSPRQLDEQMVEKFLKSFQSSESALPSDKACKPNHLANQCDGMQLRDDELALFVLLQNSYEIEASLNALSDRDKLDKGAVDLFTFIEQWSEEDCLAFEDGLQAYGKDFHQIQKNKLIHKSVNELVGFYYLWKKTERHDMLTSKVKFEKKKYQRNPNTVDLMDNFLDGGDQQSTGNQNSFNSTSSSHNNSVPHKHASSLTLLPSSAPNHHLSKHRLTSTNQLTSTVSSTDLAVNEPEQLPEEESSNHSSDGRSSALVINEVANEEEPTTVKTVGEPTASSNETRPDSSSVLPPSPSIANDSVTSSTNPSAE